MSLSRADIQRAFQNALGRAASQADENAFFAASQGGTSDAQIFQTISNGREADIVTDPVIRFYQAAFGRVPDAGGLDNWQDYIRANGPSQATYTDVATLFTQQTEFTNRYGTGTTVDAAYVQALYRDILGRDASAAEVAGYVSGSAGYTGRGGVLYAISQSQEAFTRSDAAVNAFLENAAEGDASYTGSLPGVSGGTQPTPPAEPTTPTQPTNPGGGGGTPQPGPSVFSIAAASADKAEGTVEFLWEALTELRVSEEPIREPSVGTPFTFTVTRTNGSGTAEIGYAVVLDNELRPLSTQDLREESRATGSDFVDGTSGTVQFVNGETTKTVTVYVNPDSDVERDERFTVRLENAPSGTTIATNAGTADGVIRNDDALFSIAVDPVSVAEGNSGDGAVLTYTVTRDGDLSEAASVGVRLTGTASNGSDYTTSLTDGTVAFAAGAATATFTVTTRPDTAGEPDETVTARLTGVTSGRGTVDFEFSEATGTIRDDDTVTLTPNADTVSGSADADVINGTVDLTTPASNTFTAADRIDGAGGTDRFNIAVTGASGAVAIPLTDGGTPTVSNVEIFNIRNTSGQTATFDAAAIAGEQQVWNDQSTSGAVSVTGLATGATIGVRGNITSGFGQPDATNTSFTYANATDAVTIAVDGGVGYNFIFGPQGPNITRAQSGEAAVTINSTGAANYVNRIDLDNGAATITSVTINATTSLNAILSADDYATDSTLTLTGAGAINLQRNSLSANILDIDATGSSGGVDIRAQNGGDLTFTGGTGNDTLRLGATLTAAGRFDGGDGIDTVEIAGGTYTAPDDFTLQGIQVLNNIEQLRFTDNTTIDNNLVQSAITKLIFADGGDDVVLNSGSRTYAFQGDEGNARFIAATNAEGVVVEDVLNLEFDRSAGTSFENTVTVEGHTTVAIATTGTSLFGQSDFDEISELRVAPGTIVNITGPNNFLLNRVTFNDTVSDPDRAIGVTINAQGSSGQTNIGGSSRSDTIFAGPGGGQINSRGGADDITLGAGTDTVIEFGDSRAQTTGTATHDTVRNFTAGTDKIGTFITVQSVQQGANYTAVGGDNLVQAIGNAINAGSENTGLAARAAAIVTLTGTTNAGTYLVINDATFESAGYTAADSVIKLVGLTGTLSASDFVNQD